MTLLQDTISTIPPLDDDAMRAAKVLLRSLTMPDWALGRLCDLAVRLAGISGKMPPPVDRRTIAVMAGDHGVVAEGVSPHDAKVTGQMVANMTAGGAGVNVLGRLNGADIVVADFGMRERDEDLVRRGLLLDCNIGRGTANMAAGPAMSRDDARRSLEAGIRLAATLSADNDVLGTGEMGIGNSTPAAAIAAVFTGRPARDVVGPGAGLGAGGLGHKAAVIEKALGSNRPDPNDPVDVLAKVGGYEIGGIAGFILGCAAKRRPVLVDGFISTAGAMLARTLSPAAMEHAIFAHVSAEPGHTLMCEWLGRRPLLSLDMRLGEGTGAAMALNLVDASRRLLTEMATFASANVSAHGAP